MYPANKFLIQKVHYMKIQTYFLYLV